MWTALLDGFLRRAIRVGRLTLEGPPGTGTREFGSGADGPEIHLVLKEPGVVRRLATNPELALGEAYMDGTMEIVQGDIAVLLELLFRNHGHLFGDKAFERRIALRRAVRRISQHAPAHRARRNVAHHYDLSGELYDLFLDTDRQYSCAYFARPDMTLEQAQQAKKRHIAAKLNLEPGMRVLDIGCGWGGMALTLARDYGAKVVGVTLSEEQLAVAQRRAQEEGLADRVAFRLQDYRRVREDFDRIVSVGMFEHVGVPHYREYFDFVDAHLEEDGIALIHTIGHRGGPAASNPWIAKYIFPGGYTPAMSEVVAPIEKTGLNITDIEVLRSHYAMTLEEWNRRFQRNRDKAVALYDERFARMWEFYLLSMVESFSRGALQVFQFQISKRAADVPITRDYLYSGPERRSMAAE